MHPQDVEDELDLRHYLDVLRRRWLVVLIATALVTLLAVGVSLVQTEMYRATSEVLLQGNDAEQRLGSGDQTNQFRDDNRVATEIGVIESNLVESAVEEQLGREPDVSASPAGDTDIIEISATSSVPEDAAEEANTYAQVYVEWRRQRTIDDLLAAQQTVQEEVDSIEARIDELEQPITDLQNQLVAAPGESERADLQAQIDEAESNIETERNALENTLVLYQSELSSLQVSQRITRTGGVQLITQADVPESPFSPQPLRNGALGVVVGLILGVGIAFLRETLDDRVRSKERLEQVTGWPTLGLVPVIARAKGGAHDLVTLEAPGSPASEAYRSLRTALQFVALESPLKVIQVTSAHSGDGKTTTAANLAVMIARTGKRVILLDADLRKPRLHDEFGLGNTAGFTTMLLDSVARADSFKRTALTELLVVPSGPPPPNPAELLSLKMTERVIAGLREQTDVLIIDSPPVLPVTDPLVLSAYVDGVLVVTDATTARGRDLVRARELLDQANANVVGIMVNRVPAEGTYAYGYGYGYGDSYGYDAGDESFSESPGRRRNSSADRAPREVDDGEPDDGPAPGARSSRFGIARR